MKKTIRAPATVMIPAAVPTPIPALAPVLRPGDGVGSDDATADGLVPAGRLVAPDVGMPVAAIAEVEEVEVLEVMAAL